MLSPQKITTEITEYTEREESDSLTGDIIGAAIEVHRAWGPKAFRISLRAVFDL